MIKDLQPSELDSVPNVFWLTPADALDRFAGKYIKSVKYFYQPPDSRILSASLYPNVKARKISANFSDSDLCL